MRPGESAEASMARIHGVLVRGAIVVMIAAAVLLPLLA